MIAFPQVGLFQIVFSLLSPFVDLLFIFQLIWTGIDYLQHREQFVPDKLIHTSLFFALFVLVEMGAAALAIALETQEDWRLLLWLPLQRFGYRQLMYYVVVKSVFKALSGPLVGRGKLDRSGTVTVQTLS